MKISTLPSPEKLMEQNGWDGYNSIVDVRDIEAIQVEAYNQALNDAINRLKHYIVQDCDSTCDCCNTRKIDIMLIATLSIK